MKVTGTDGRIYIIREHSIWRIEENEIDTCGNENQVITSFPSEHKIWFPLHVELK